MQFWKGLKIEGKKELINLTAIYILISSQSEKWRKFLSPSSFFSMLPVTINSTMAKTEIIYLPKKCGGIYSNEFHIKWIIGIHGIWNNQNPGSHFGVTSTTNPAHLPQYWQNWPNRQCCLAGSSKTAHRILIFSIAMGTDKLFYVKFIATYAPTFFGYIISVWAIVIQVW